MAAASAASSRSPSFPGQVAGDGDEVPNKRKGVVLRLVWDLLEGDRIVTLSEKNKISREMKKTTHTTGTKSCARWYEDMRRADPEKNSRTLQRFTSQLIGKGKRDK
ncbi:unnamed protein product [Miscanthus lutarioriparius]|uniref:Uncharacterized protein n=1 Tax=Miscanthus lutarioriparius TaxID=422564 RepID=A0A811MDJ3_9POAL|nr:unnamed protein product [Miscanthus lutarioriparius]